MYFHRETRAPMAFRVTREKVEGRWVYVKWLHSCGTIQTLEIMCNCLVSPSAFKEVWNLKFMSIYLIWVYSTMSVFYSLMQGFSGRKGPPGLPVLKTYVLFIVKLSKNQMIRKHYDYIAKVKMKTQFYNHGYVVLC